MRGERRTMWDVLDGDWLYLGRPLPGVIDVATLVDRSEKVAPLYASNASADPFRKAAPAGLELLSIPAEDHRAKEEWLRAVLAQGVTTIAFDPDPLSLRPAIAFSARNGLWYVLSHMRATACI